jgi:hypothetical protein
VNLKSLIKGELESLEQFEARTSWITYKYEERVFVYNNQEERDNPNCKPREIWDLEKARRYVENLESDVERAKLDERDKEVA